MDEKNIYRELGKQIREIRRNSGKKLKEVSLATGIPVASLSKFENRGEILRSIEKVYAILDYLGYALNIEQKKTLGNFV